MGLRQFLLVLTLFVLGGGDVACWSHGHSYRECCGPPPKAECFDEQFTQARCCDGQDPAQNTPLQAPLLRFPAPQLVSRAELQGARVDLIVRSHGEVAEELLLLARSLEMYWPKDHAGDVFFVLDETEKDTAVCSLLPSWITCILEDPPKITFFIQKTRALGRGLLSGMLRKEMSQLESDRYGTAEYIAVMDADVVFHSYGAPEIFFGRTEAGAIQPLQYGRASGGLFPWPVRILGIQWQAEFMDTFPQVFHRAHFKKCRDYVARVMRPHLRREGLQDNFHNAFNVLSKLTSEFSNHAEFPSFHTVMGSFTWAFKRSSYVWAIQYGWLTGVAWNYTCPGLRLVTHVTYSDRRFFDLYHQPLVREQIPQDQVSRLRSTNETDIDFEVNGALYSIRAWGLMLSGLCAVRWNVRHQAADFEANWIARKAEACHLQEKYNLSRLLLSNGYSREWLEREAPHCAGRRPSSLLREYFETYIGRMSQSVGA